MNKGDLIYLAGYADGEGCFWLGSHPYYKIGLTIANTHRPTIEWLHKTFGGNFSGRGDKKKEHHRPVYNWSIVSKQAETLIEQLIPFLKEKKEQAQLLLMMRDTQQKYTKPIRPSVLLHREYLATEFKGTKHVAS